MDAPNPTPPTARPIRFRRGRLALIGVVLFAVVLLAAHAPSRGASAGDVSGQVTIVEREGASSDDLAQAG